MNVKSNSRFKFKVLVLLTLLAGSVQAEKATHYGDTGAWGVFVDDSLGGGCFTLAEFANDRILRIGINNVNQSYYLVVSDIAWKSLKHNQVIKGAQMVMGNETPWLDVDFKAHEFAPEIVGLWVYILWENGAAETFLRELAEEEDLKVYYKDRMIFGVGLGGSREALAMVADCQLNQDTKGTSTNSDPFIDS